MVGTAGSGLGGVDRSQPVSAISSEVVGSAEGAPTAVVAAATGAGVARVSVSFAGGASDAMAPVDGWVALAAPVPSSVANGSNVGTLTGRDSAGKVLTSRALQLGLEAERAATVGVLVHLPGGGAQSGATANSAASAQLRVACPPLPCSTLPSAEGQGSANPSGVTASPPSSVGIGGSVGSPTPATAPSACPTPVGGSGAAPSSGGTPGSGGGASSSGGVSSFRRCVEIGGVSSSGGVSTSSGATP